MTPDDWPQLLREQGRTMTWLAGRLGVSRQYLSAVATGSRNASPALLGRIHRELAAHPAPERLDTTLEYTIRRAMFLAMRDRVTGVLLGHDTLASIDHSTVEDMAEDITRAVLLQVSVAVEGIATA